MKLAINCEIIFGSQRERHNNLVVNTSKLKDALKKEEKTKIQLIPYAELNLTTWISPDDVATNSNRPDDENLIEWIPSLWILSCLSKTPVGTA